LITVSCVFLRGKKIMAKTDVQQSRLTEALDNQFEADKEFETKSKAVFEPAAPSSLPPAQLEAEKEAETITVVLDSPSSPPAVTPDSPPEHQQFEANIPQRHRAHAKRPKAKIKVLGGPPAESQRPTSSPPLLPQVFEDRYSRGWSDAWDLIKPEQYEFQRRYILAKERNASVDRWMKWLPVICFCCTLFGFASGWLWASSTSRSWSTAQTLDTSPRAAGDRGDKFTP
jgi:hypothetical protein